jgi:hypothetical protein
MATDSQEAPQDDSPFGDGEFEQPVLEEPAGRATLELLPETEPF